VPVQVPTGNFFVAMRLGEDLGRTLSFSNLMSDPVTIRFTNGVPDVTGNRVRAGFHLRHEPLGEKLLKQRWERGFFHTPTSFAKALTARWEASPSNSGTALIYQ